ncbi:uncharacterized protein MELLADRAFT_86617 [Melampsora larici-populina 98AG31]|uniref:Secreted protein n=1 Tax=Melampsora larici-populina (strain 98AG31 / pathotype 3-4-7) TaxID=747676 RepID=F4RMF8_MELLP|nr:uncharacterized protein MELLADRAFT_86617 [Melampsora larici-populina 98AG31]EGG06481.1 secreted protein [Melampsora larici-populina 98AG31]
MSLNLSFLIPFLIAIIILETRAQTRPPNQITPPPTTPQAGGPSTLQRPQPGNNPQSQQTFTNNPASASSTTPVATNLNPGLEGVNSLTDPDGTLKATVQAVSREYNQMTELVKQFRIAAFIPLSSQQTLAQESFLESLSPEQRVIFDNHVKYLILTPTQRAKERDFMSSFVTPKVKVANQAGFDAVKRDLLPEAQRDFDPAEGMKNMGLTTDQQRRFRNGVQRYLANPSARLEAEQATMPSNAQRRLLSNSSSNLVPLLTLSITFLSCFIILS